MVVTWAYNAGTNTATGSGAGSTNYAAVIAADTAGGWGKVTADASGNLILQACKIVVGDETNACAFADTDKLVLINGVANGGKAIAVAANSSLTLGTASDTTNKYTDSGCTFYMMGVTSTSAIIYPTSWANSATIYLYGCNFQGVHNSYNIQIGGFQRAWNCHFGTRSYLFPAANADIANCVGDTMSKLDIAATGLTVNGLTILSPTNNYIEVEASATVNNVIGRGIGAGNAFAMWAGKTLTAVDCDFDSWKILWYGNATINRQNIFNLKVLDDSGAAISGATVTVTDTDSTEVVDTTTNASGVIAEQTLLRGAYTQANDQTLDDSSPHTLTVSKSGYIPFTQVFTLAPKTNWTITLHDQLTGDAAVGDVANGKKFYKDDADTQLTGTYTSPVLTGTATEADVLKGRTFYSNDAATKQTGELTAAVQVVEKEVSTKKEEYALALVGVLIAQKENMRKQGGFNLE